MKLNDPFGRVARRDRAQYTALKARLQEAQIRDAQALEVFAANTRTALLRLLLVVVAVSAGMVLLFPAASSLIVLLGTLGLLWLAVSYVQTHLYLRRYLREECGPR